MNFNTLVNTKGIKGSRRGGNAKGLAAKAMTVTKDVTMKAAGSVAGFMPATNNKVNGVDYESITRDRELMHEVAKNRVAIDELRAALGMAPVPVSTPEEVTQAVLAMEESYDARVEAERAASPTMLAKLQEALLGSRAPQTEAVQEAVQEALEEVIAEMPPVYEAAPITAEPVVGATRRFVSSPEASAYDYNDISEQAQG